MADKVQWDVFEVKYASLFPSGIGNVAKPLHIALCFLIIQNWFQFLDRELVEQITKDPYLQYFIDLPVYQNTPLFDTSMLVLFCKRVIANMLNEVNEYICSQG